MTTKDDQRGPNFILEPPGSLIPEELLSQDQDGDTLPSDALLAARFRELNHKSQQEEAGDEWDGWYGWNKDAQSLFHFTRQALKLSDLKTRKAVLDALAARCKSYEAFQLYVLAGDVPGAGITEKDLAELFRLDQFKVGSTLFDV